MRSKLFLSILAIFLVLASTNVKADSIELNYTLKQTSQCIALQAEVMKSAGSAATYAASIGTDITEHANSVRAKAMSNITLLTSAVEIIIEKMAEETNQPVEELKESWTKNFQASYMDILKKRMTSDGDEYIKFVFSNGMRCVPHISEKIRELTE